MNTYPPGASPLDTADHDNRCRPSDPACRLLFSGTGMMESQSLGPDRLSARARDARGRFARGSSGNPRGRPPGIPNPKRRVPDLVARPLSAQALSHLLDRKPYLLRPLAAQLLPPPLRTIDPAERLGIDLASLRTVEDVRKVLARVWTAISRGEIAPVEGARVTRRMRGRLRVLRRFARLEKRHAAFPADEEEIPPLEEFARDEGERLRPLGANGNLRHGRTRSGNGAAALRC
jgi:hypothetical protein